MNSVFGPCQWLVFIKTTNELYFQQINLIQCINATVFCIQLFNFSGELWWARLWEISTVQRSTRFGNSCWSWGCFVFTQLLVRYQLKYLNSFISFHARSIPFMNSYGNNVYFCLFVCDLTRPWAFAFVIPPSVNFLFVLFCVLLLWNNSWYSHETSHRYWYWSLVHSLNINILLDCFVYL